MPVGDASSGTFEKSKTMLMLGAGALALAALGLFVYSGNKSTKNNDPAEESDEDDTTIRAGNIQANSTPK